MKCIGLTIFVKLVCTDKINKRLQWKRTGSKSKQTIKGGNKKSITKNWLIKKYPTAEVR